jgi:hypothetical protein
MEGVMGLVVESENEDCSDIMDMEADMTEPLGEGERALAQNSFRG